MLLPTMDQDCGLLVSGPGNGAGVCAQSRALTPMCTDMRHSQSVRHVR